MVAAGDYDGRVRVWDTSTGSLSATLRASARVGSVVVASGSAERLLAAAGSDGIVHLWNARTLQPVGSLGTSYSTAVTGLAFGPNETLAAGTEDGTVRLFSIRARRAVGLLETLTGASYTDVAAFAPTGRLVATGDGSGVVRLWDPASGGQLGQYLGPHHAEIMGVAFGSDGRTLAAASYYGSVLIWSDFFWPNFASLKRRVCALTGGDLTRDDWAFFARGIPYQRPCGVSQ
jgi:WD40 repeat protein